MDLHNCVVAMVHVRLFSQSAYLVQLYTGALSAGWAAGRASPL